MKAKQKQLTAIEQAIRKAQFVRNRALHYWFDNKGVNKYGLKKYCRVLARELDFAEKFNSTAKQLSAERGLNQASPSSTTVRE